MAANNNTTVTYSNLEVEYKAQSSNEAVNLILNGMEQEREMLISRLRFVENTLLEHGRISQKHVKVRAR
jgi:hypothetical protein